MISSYPDYFAAIPMMPRGIPVVPGYPPAGEVPSPMADTYDPEGEEEEDLENDVNEKDAQEDSQEDTQRDNSEEEENENQDDTESREEIDPEFTRQAHPAPAAGTTGTAGTSSFEMAPGSPVVQDTDYIQGYLRTQIGKRVRVTFLLGTGTMQDRTGILESVGISYIILREDASNTRELADIYSIKFVVIFDE